MASKIKIRCGKCGKVLVARPGINKKLGKCPSCGVRFTIPSISQVVERKKPRIVISENGTFLAQLPASLTRKQEDPLFRVTYTEASPVQFALRRLDQVPILDMSEDGLSVYLRKDDQASSLKVGSGFTIEIDFPILVQPIYTKAVLRWVKPVVDTELLQVGVQFQDANESLQHVMKLLMDFILSRSSMWEAVTVSE